VHELQRTFVQYILMRYVPTLHILKNNYCEQYCELEKMMLLENMSEDCNVDDVLYVLGNPQKET